jgi:hypothetical protein
VPANPTHFPGPDVELPASAVPATDDIERELTVCRKLRTKLAFTPLVTTDGEPLLWQKGDGSTAVYWCCSTMECAGPDGGLVHATLCRDDRACYRSRG